MRLIIVATAVGVVALAFKFYVTTSEPAVVSPRRGHTVAEKRPLQHDRVKGPSLPQEVKRTVLVEQSKAQPVAAALQGQYDSVVTKYEAIIESLQASGPPRGDERWMPAGGRMGSEMVRAGISDDWQCYNAGCYFRIRAESAKTDALAHDIVQIRNGVAHGYVVAITADEPPYKLAILLNYRPDEEERISQVRP